MKKDYIIRYAIRISSRSGIWQGEQLWAGKEAPDPDPRGWRPVGDLAGRALRYTPASVAVLNLLSRPFPAETRRKLRLARSPLPAGARRELQTAAMCRSLIAATSRGPSPKRKVQQLVNSLNRTVRGYRALAEVEALTPHADDSDDRLDVTLVFRLAVNPREVALALSTLFGLQSGLLRVCQKCRNPFVDSSKRWQRCDDCRRRKRRPYLRSVGLGAVFDWWTATRRRLAVHIVRGWRTREECDAIQDDIRRDMHLLPLEALVAKYNPLTMRGARSPWRSDAPHRAAHR